MRRSIFLSGFALLISGSSAISPARAGSSNAVQTADALASQKPSLLADPAEASQAYEPESSDLAIREVQPIQVQDQQPGNPWFPASRLPLPPTFRSAASPPAKPAGTALGSMAVGPPTVMCFAPETSPPPTAACPSAPRCASPTSGTGRSAVVRINDRGPFVGHRLIDLGPGAASHLGLVASGVASVRLEVLR
jgi:rare lipoprotein A